MKISFAKDMWDTEEITYAYSYRFEEVPVFVQMEDCVENRKNSETPQGYDNITLLTKKQYISPTKICTRCAFEGNGAPLITIADRLCTDSRSMVRYGDYLEIVLWKNGVNVWRMWMNDGKVTWKKLMGMEFSVSEGEVHTLSAEIKDDMLLIQADEQKISLHVEDMYTAYHLGINACEGINRFYDMVIENI